MKTTDKKTSTGKKEKKGDERSEKDCERNKNPTEKHCIARKQDSQRRSRTTWEYLSSQIRLFTVKTQSFYITAAFSTVFMRTKFHVYLDDKKSSTNKSNTLRAHYMFGVKCFGFLTR